MGRPDAAETARLSEATRRVLPCYVNPRTTLAEVDGLADAVRRIGDRVSARAMAPSA